MVQLPLENGHIFRAASKTLFKKNQKNENHQHHHYGQSCRLVGKPLVVGLGRRKVNEGARSAPRPLLVPVWGT